jgi:hypothetical protein
MLWCCVFVFGILVIMSRKHYSLDVVVAWYTVPLVWSAYDTYYPDRVPQEVLDAEAKLSDGREVALESIAINKE